MPPVRLAHDDGLSGGQRSDEFGRDAVGLLQPPAGCDAESGCAGLVEVLPDGGRSGELEERLGHRDAVDDGGADVRHEPLCVLTEAREALSTEHEGHAG